MDIRDDHQLTPEQNTDPLLWVVTTPAYGQPVPIKVSDEALAPAMGTGRSRKLKSFGHDDEGVHFLLTRNGTNVHTDPAYLRYSHQLVLRNDSNRLRGLPRYDRDPERWPVLEPGIMYCLDTHSPHQGLPDKRQPVRKPHSKVVIAVDRSHPLHPEEAWELIAPWLGVELAAVVDTVRPQGASLRWKETG